MTFQKFKTNSFCVGAKHYSGTKNISGEITFKKNCWRNKIVSRKMHGLQQEKSNDCE